MEFGVQVSVYRVEWDAVRATVEAMEAGQWDSLWFADHFIPPGATHDEEALTAHEGVSALAFAGGMTSKLKLGNLVLGNIYRNPALVAKIAGTMDTMSKGRYTLALGAGWYQREHEAYGWTFPSMKERQDRLEESVELIRLLIHSSEPVDYKGKYYEVNQARLSPGSYGDPIPIMIGGSGPKRTLRTLARYGDVMNLDGWAGAGLALDYYKYKAGILEQHCEDWGRDPAEIRRTIMMPLFMTDKQDFADRMVAQYGPGTMAGPRQYLVDRIGEFAEAGVSEVILGGIATGDLNRLQQVEEQIVSAFK